MDPLFARFIASAPYDSFRFRMRLSLILLLVGAVAFYSVATTIPSVPAQGYGGGRVTGYVYSYTMYDELIPIVWADIEAKSGSMRLVAYSGGNGFYEMYVPTGTWTLTVTEPGYKPQSMPVVISNGATLGINFYLERSQVPIPEYDQVIAPVILAFGLALAVLVSRRRKLARV